MYKNLPFDARSITAPDFPSSSAELCTGMKILFFPYVNTTPLHCPSPQPLLPAAQPQGLEGPRGQAGRWDTPPVLLQVRPHST